jgi:trehalose 6-phosphate synthase/phosphatase
MEQKKPDPPADPLPPRSPSLDRSESSLPPHLRPSVFEVPVTPDITRAAYDPFGSRGGDGTSESYFDQYHKDIDHELVASPGLVPTDLKGNFHAQVLAGAEGSKEFLRQLKIAVMGSRRESISEIRKTSPDLSLSGNIISATFNIPHSLKYRKGADWVSAAVFSRAPPSVVGAGRAKSGWWG